MLRVWSRRLVSAASTNQEVLSEPILTTAMKERILELHKQDPEKWTKEVLASRFKISTHTIKFLFELDKLAQRIESGLDEEALHAFRKMYERRKTVESSNVLSNQRASFSEPQVKPLKPVKSWPKFERKDDLAGETTDSILVELGFRAKPTEDKQQIDEEVERVRKYLEPPEGASYRNFGLLDEQVSPRRTRYIFVDISRKRTNDARPIFVRDHDGKLRDATKDERLKVLSSLGGPYDILQPYLKQYYLERPLDEQVEEQVAIQARVTVRRKFLKLSKKAKKKGTSSDNDGDSPNS
eukprot:jgi/Galph1/506/GphlegSOOS_G5232.1